MTLVVGLTGGIGSGKSTAAELFAQLGVPIIDADEIARALVKPGTPALVALTNRFGQHILESNGQLDRQALRQIIFTEPDQKEWLESLLHPEIHQVILQKISEVNYPYCMVVIPLLTENFSHYQDVLHHILVIDTTDELQLLWTTQRDRCSQNLVEKIMLSQASRDQRLKIAHTVLVNDASKLRLQNKITQLHNSFLTMVPIRSSL